MLGALTMNQFVLVGAGALLGGAIFGVAGFAYGIIASLFLHHGFPAPDVIFIVVSGALVLNLGMLPRFWRDIDIRRSLPYLAGATLGLPIGLFLLSELDPRVTRTFIALLIIGYCLFALRQQSRDPLRFTGGHGALVDGLVGMAGGAIGGISGLGPMVPAIWYGLRGLSKQEQRALTQPYGIYVQGIMVTWLLGTSTVSPAAIAGITTAAPIMLASAFVGLMAFDRMSTSRFQRLIILLAIVGALFLLASQF